VKALLVEDRDFPRPIVEAVLPELLEAEMTEALGPERRADAGPDRPPQRP
jgi:transposase-like protein